MASGLQVPVILFSDTALGWLSTLRDMTQGRLEVVGNVRQATAIPLRGVIQMMTPGRLEVVINTQHDPATTPYDARPSFLR